MAMTDRTVKKIGKWTIAWTNGHLRVDDGWQSSYPIYYPHNGQIAYDFPERIPKAVQAVVKRELTKPKTSTNPLFAFKKYYVTCDGKKFGPFATRAKAKKVAVSIARVLDKPAKIMGEVKAAKNSNRLSGPGLGSIRKTKKRMKTRGGGLQHSALTLNLLRRGRGGVKPKRKFKTKTKRNPSVQFVVEVSGRANFFNTLKQAKTYKAGLYSRGLLYGRRVRIVRMETRKASKILFEKTY